ncbi:CDP-glycerol glycerophosphotransferase family protein [Agromyces sp. NPDC058110]|uniref:CDP-glycerol glycerophosphotransferase family protein n=1 Tax=Agromyces sp. NPDC058110 TaxID=3346345 RepID=UPI0036DBB873
MTPARPTLSLVIPVYNVERWLPAFLESIAAQGTALESAELVFAIDGATDGSERVIRDWVDRHQQVRVQIVTKENGGLSSARNAGMAVATGVWISFPDPDDVLGKGYVRALVDFVEREDVDVAVARFLPFFGDPASATDNHSFGFRFARGTRIVDIDESPRFFPFAVNSALFKTDLIRSIPLEFDDRVSTVEDGVFTAELLANLPRRRVAFVAAAEYFYRKRDDGTSQLDNAWTRADRFDGALEHGFARVAGKYFADREVPRWLQYMMMYDLQWYFKMDLRNDSPTAGLSAEECAAINRRFERYLGFISARVIQEFNVTDIPPHIREAWLVRSTGTTSEQEVHVADLDVARGLVCLRYFTDSVESTETIRLDGVVVEPFASKTRAIVYFKEAWVWERIVWVPAMQDLSVQLPGQAIPGRLRFGHQGQSILEATPGHIWQKLRQRIPPFPNQPRRVEPVHVRRSFLRRLMGRARRELGGLRQRFWLMHAKSSASAKKYRNAWLLIDRDSMGRDNAESLYRYIAKHEPGINAYFVVNREAPDYSRLQSEGFRVVAHRSREHLALLFHARHLISSQIDHYILHPFSQAAYQRPVPTFTFLSHGVTHNDLSRWMNAKPIALTTAATAQEAHEFVRSGSPYKLTSKEVVLTGFARHDELEEMASTSRRDLLLIMPTWRKTLLQLVDGQTNNRAALDGFRESQYFRSWMDVVASDSLRRAAEQAGLQIAFAPHPNMQGHILPADVPDWVQLVSYRDSDIKTWIARSKLAVTDYSSLAFEAAYVGSGVVYYQFDRDAFFSGSHAFRRGEFSYEADGFGPVVRTHEEAVEAIESAVLDADAFDREYGDRIREAFAFRDGRASERTVAAIRALEKRVGDGA